MTELTNKRPDANEYPTYFGKYVALVPDEEILQTLSRQLEQTLAVLGSIPEERAGFRYEPDKWSIKELVGHLMDAERIFSYRALRFARGDETPLPGYEQDDYIRAGSFDGSSLAELAAAFADVRRASLSLFSQLDAAAWNRRGKASDCEVSVRALAYIIAGHELHHMGILRERYLSSEADLAARMV